MFINISNHPTSKWGREQFVDACIMGGSIVDEPFPVIKPDATREDNEAFARSFITGISPHYDDVIHVMGEMGFTYAVVIECKRRGLKVVHSTTERISTENVDGTKTASFKFVQFREY